MPYNSSGLLTHAFIYVGEDSEGNYLFAQRNGVSPAFITGMAFEESLAGTGGTIRFVTPLTALTPAPTPISTPAPTPVPFNQIVDNVALLADALLSGNLFFAQKELHDYQSLPSAAKQQFSQAVHDDLFGLLATEAVSQGQFNRAAIDALLIADGFLTDDPLLVGLGLQNSQSSG